MDDASPPSMKRLRALAEQVVHSLGNDPVKNVESFLVGIEAKTEDRTVEAVITALVESGHDASWLTSAAGRMAVRRVLDSESAA